MKFSNVLLASALIGLCLIVVLTSAQDQPKELTPRQRFQLPKIFDFERFRVTFRKTYKSAAELIVRQKLFLARAFRAFLSAIKYKHNISSYYLKINNNSDQTPAELESMEMKIHADNAEAAKAQPIPQATIEQIHDELVNLDEVSRKEGHEDILHELESKTSRRKRQVGSRRDITIDDIIGQPIDETESPEVRAKIKEFVPSNNPDRVDPEFMSYGLEQSDQEEKPIESQEFFEKVAARDEPGFLANFASFWMKPATPTIEAEQDRMFVDFREGGCMFKPRDQGHCGCCYSYAMTSMIEYLHCKETGNLVAFSEQYFIDCGFRNKLLDGCNGAYLENTAHFVIKYGMELRISYPFRARADFCPYADSTPPHRMGYLRPKATKVFQLPVNYGNLKRYLPKTPLMIAISTKGDFHEYGGGVHSGEGCYFPATHAVLLVGRGIEDGKEFWLIRNSHSVAYGEGGYYKLSVEATSKCIQGDAIFIGIDKNKVGFFASPNTSNDGKSVKQRYVDYMMGVDVQRLDEIYKPTQKESVDVV